MEFFVQTFDFAVKLASHVAAILTIYEWLMNQK